MTTEIFGFRVGDNDRQEPWEDEDYMFYTSKENILVPVRNDFLLGLPPIPHHQAIAFLRKSKIKNITTFEPESGVVSSSPYDREDEDDFRECQDDGDWYRFSHVEIDRGSRLEEFMKGSGIILNILNPEDARSLNKGLKYEYESY